MGSFALAACGGGGGASGSVPPVAHDASPTQTPKEPPTSSQGIAHFTISDPYGTSQSAKRRPLYFSPDTSAISITANGTTAQQQLLPNSPNCTVANSTITCTVDVPVTDGPLNYTVQTLDPANHPLSQASGTATIDGTTTIPLTLQGIWKSASVLLASPHPVMGGPATIDVKVAAYDDGGALIIGPQTYTSPIPLQNSDTSGATSLSEASVTYPGESITLAYNGKSYVDATIAAIDPNTGYAAGEVDVLVPALRVMEYPIPSGSVTSSNAGHGRMIRNADGSITFLEQNLHVGRVTMAGTVSERTIPHYYFDIAEGADGKLYGITNNSTMDRINADGSATQVAQLPGDGGTVVLGSDGNLWATFGSNVGLGVSRITPAGNVTSFVATNVHNLGDAVLGTDGNLWYAAEKNYTGEFVRLTPSGQFTEVPLPSSDCCNVLGDIALGPDGELYSAMQNGLVERTTNAGVVSHLQGGQLQQPFSGVSTPNALGFGADRALWIAEPTANVGCYPTVERMTTSGAFANLILPVDCNSGPLPPITAFITGPDGNLWYTRDTFVGKIVLK